MSKGLAYSKLNPKKWIEQLLPRIGSTPFSKLTIPGTHDSATYHLTDKPVEEDENSKFTKIRWINSFINKIAKAQTLNITEQLNHGIRYFDLRAATDKNNDWYAFHGFYGDPLEKIFQNISEFIKENKNEIVIIEVSHFTGPKTISVEDPVSHSQDKEIDFSKLKNSIQEIFEGKLFDANPKNFDFTIRDMLNKNQNILLFGGNDKEIQKIGANWSSESNLFDKYTNTDSVEELIKVENGKENNIYNQIKNLKLPNNKLLKVSWTLTPQADATIIKNLLPGRSLLHMADDANRELEKYWNKHKSEITRMGNILIIDHFTPRFKEFFKVVLESNGITDSIIESN